MPYEIRVVAFIDMLGFRKRIRGTIGSDGLPIPKQVNHLEHSIIRFREINNPPEEWIWELEGHEKPTSIFVSQFSDSLVVSCSADRPEEISDFLERLFWTQVNLIRHEAGLIFRGGVAIGHLVHNHNVLFGPAMNDAYDLEHNTAHNPRIVLGNDVYQMAAAGNNPRMKAEGWTIDDIVKLDNDGLYYINYFDSKIGSGRQGANENEWKEYRDKLKTIIDKGLDCKDDCIRNKYVWMNAKYLAVNLE